MTISESDSGDDLATLQNIFADANAPQDGVAVAPAVESLMADLKMKRMRLLQADNYCDIDSNGNFGMVPLDAIISGNFVPGVVTPGDCLPFLWPLQRTLNSNLSPHVALGSTMPLSFTPYGAAETWSPETMGHFKIYAQKLVNYIAQKSFDGGASSVVFEVSNELDIAESEPVNWVNANPHPPFSLLPLGPWGRFLWWIDPASYDLQQWPPTDNFSYPHGGDVRRLDHGIAPMQKIFGDAIAAVMNDPSIQASYPGKTIQFAGPALAGFSFQFINYSAPPVRTTLEEQFLDAMLDPTADVDPTTGVAKYNTSLDYFSFHYYNDFRNETTGIPPSDPQWNASRQTTTLKAQTDLVRNKLIALGHPETRLFLSEWGPTVDEGSDINWSHKGAAWAAAFLTEAVAAHVAMGSYLIMHDAVGYDPGRLGQASLMHKAITDGVAAYYPKPAANVFKMFAMMTGTRRAVTLPTASSNLGAFAASDANSAGVVIFNYDYSYAFADTPRTFSVELNNLPLNGVVTVERYLVDANTSNLKAFLTQPGQPDPSLQKVEQFSAQVNNGQLILPSRTLGLGVTFWRILG
jgi:hypothetical protein